MADPRGADPQGNDPEQDDPKGVDPVGSDPVAPDHPITSPPVGLAARLDDADPRSAGASADPEETLFRFPCAYPIKAMGRAEHDIATLVLALATRHAPELTAAALTVRPSSTGKWLSVTVTVQAQSKAQLDAIYRDLTAHEHIAYVL